MAILDIHSSRRGPAGQLSNLAVHEFVFRGIPVKSIECILQAVKFEGVKRQNHVLAMAPWDAFEYGKRYGQGWKRRSRGRLWWQGEPMMREGDEYRMFLDEAYWALASNDGFRDNLLRSWPAQLVHTIGGQDPYTTVLTEEEFCTRLMNMREHILERQGGQ